MKKFDENKNLLKKEKRFEMKKIEKEAPVSEKIA